MSRSFQSQNSTSDQTQQLEAHRRGVVTARQCLQPVSVQTWYGDNYETCSMHETRVDCGSDALTSPCPPNRVASTTVTQAQSSALPTSPPVYSTGAASTQHGLSAGTKMGIVIGTIIATAVVVCLLVSCWRSKRRSRNVVERGHVGLQLGRRHLPKPSVSTVDSETVSSDANDGSVRLAAPPPSPPPVAVAAPPPPPPAALQPQARPPRLPPPPPPPPLDRGIVGRGPEGPRPPGAWPIEPQENADIVGYPYREERRHNVHWQDEQERQRRERERYAEQQRENLRRERQMRIDAEMARALQQEEEDRAQIVVEEDPPARAPRRRNGEIRALIDDNNEQDRRRQGSAPDRNHRSSLPEGVRRVSNRPVRDVVYDNRNQDILQIRHPSLPEAHDPEEDNIWVDHAQPLDDDNFWIRQARDPVGLRPPPPIAGERRRVRRNQPTVEDGDSL